MAGCTTIITKQGVMITANAPNISCSDGKTYFWSGTTLTGPFGMSSYNVRSFEEAVGIVIGYYGGRPDVLEFGFSTPPWSSSHGGIFMPAKRAARFHTENVCNKS